MAIYSSDFGSVSLSSIIVKDPTFNFFNHTTLMPPIDGSTVFLAGQSTEGCPIYSTSNYVWLNFTGIPMFTVQLPPSMTFGQTQSWQQSSSYSVPSMLIPGWAYMVRLEVARSSRMLPSFQSRIFLRPSGRCFSQHQRVRFTLYYTVNNC
ncbi:hypothetical protein EDB19DRAFT_102150 [Suillus lakei]|nr:hypothetical protein EDB19DRAFT_102150 [Suillus lakei]